MAEPVDLLTAAGETGSVWERDGAGFAMHGEALRIELPAGMDSASDAVTAELATIETVDDVVLPGSGPIAFGALPFDRSAPASLVVPDVLFGRASDDTAWVTTVGSASIPHVSPPLVAQDPDGFALTSPIPHSEWMTLVAKAVDAIGADELVKVVLAREVVVAANRDIHVPTVLRRLRSLYPACTIVGCPVGDSRFVAASPELLVSRRGSLVCAHPLAGTIPRSGNPATDRALEDRLLSSTKDRAEHDLVVQDVARALEPWCSALDIPATPSIIELRNVSHLGTLITGTLRSGAPSALGLAAALHPTAAVCGTPRAAALDWLAAHEGFDRGPYAGAVGWVDGRGDGEWVVGIRSAVIAGSSARLFAGVGVVDGSDPAAELAETQFKLQALLAAVVRP